MVTGLINQHIGIAIVIVIIIIIINIDNKKNTYLADLINYKTTATTTLVYVIINDGNQNIYSNHTYIYIYPINK